MSQVHRWCHLWRRTEIACYTADRQQGAVPAHNVTIDLIFHLMKKSKFVIDEIFKKPKLLSLLTDSVCTLGFEYKCSNVLNLYTLNDNLLPDSSTTKTFKQMSEMFSCHSCASSIIALELWRFFVFFRTIALNQWYFWKWINICFDSSLLLYCCCLRQWWRPLFFILWCYNVKMFREFE